MDLYRYNKQNPILLSLIVLLICGLLRTIEIFVFRMDKEIGDSFISAFLGFILILLFFNYTKSRIREVGLSSRRFTEGLPLGIILAFIALFLSFGSQYSFLRSHNAYPHLIMQEYTWLQLMFFVLLGNVLASFVEEGLFRGILLRGFMQSWSFLFANSLQALLFGIWNLIWLLKRYKTDQISLNVVLFYSILSGMIGLLMGYIYYLTSNLWVSILWHMMCSLCMNIFAVHSIIIHADSHLMLQSMYLFWLVFISAAILSVLVLHIRKSYKANIYADTSNEKKTEASVKS